MQKRVVSPGAEVLLRAGLSKGIAAKSSRVGLITNPTGVLSDLRPTWDVLAELYTLTALFSPEHGVRGDVDAGDDVPDYIDDVTGLPVYSTYGPGKDAAFRKMAELDCVFFDMQDVGARYYTYQYTMTESMEACAAPVPFDENNLDNGIDGLKAQTRKTVHNLRIGRSAKKTGKKETK